MNFTDNDVELAYKFDKYKEAAEECERQGSFIKWHSDNLCNSTDLPRYWTSGTRHDEKFLIRKECKKLPSPYNRLYTCLYWNTFIYIYIYCKNSIIMPYVACLVLRR